jgi:hypothetical protein
VNFNHLLRIEDDGADAPLLHLAGLRMPLRASRRDWAALRALLPGTASGPFGRAASSFSRILHSSQIRGYSSPQAGTFYAVWHFEIVLFDIF